MADSSFDPLALVKAMGPQTDPFSWAQLYAQDAAKGQHLREEMKNRLLAQENQQQFQAGEHGKDRGSRMTIAKYQQDQANERAKLRGQQTAAARKMREKDVDWPEGSLDVNEARDKAILDSKNFDRSKYKLVTRYGITKLVPKDQPLPPMSHYPELNPASTGGPNPYEPE